MFDIKESVIETYFVNLCARQGWLCEKFVSPGKRGVPDRIITAGPNGFICFAEIKSPTGKLSKLQELDHAERRRKGCHVFVVSSKYEAREVVATIRRIKNGET